STKANPGALVPSPQFCPNHSLCRLNPGISNPLVSFQLKDIFFKLNITFAIALIAGLISCSFFFSGGFTGLVFKLSDAASLAFLSTLGSFLFGVFGLGGAVSFLYNFHLL